MATLTVRVWLAVLICVGMMLTGSFIQPTIRSTRKWLKNRKKRVVVETFTEADIPKGATVGA